MTCYRPLKGWLSDEVNERTGKRSFTRKEKFGFTPIKIPCGNCVGCFADHARSWAIRCVHEASLYENNCFITLTFDNDHLDKSGSLVKKDFVLFMKRLRKRFGNGIRFFHCGEYGSKNERPHHHACLFNFDFPDKVLWKIRGTVKLYTSEILEKELWKMGFCTIGDVTPESAAYIARYINKKIGEKYDKYYHYNVDTGKHDTYYNGKVREYITMSRGCKKLGTGGIGAGWYDKFKSDIYPRGHLLMDGGFKVKPPLYYERKFSIDNPEEFDRIKEQRQADLNRSENTPARLETREEFHRLRGKLLRREFENGAAEVVR